MRRDETTTRREKTTTRREKTTTRREKTTTRREKTTMRREKATGETTMGPSEYQWRMRMIHVHSQGKAAVDMSNLTLGLRAHVSTCEEMHLISSCISAWKNLVRIPAMSCCGNESQLDDQNHQLEPGHDR
ncbi:hypothetical protein RJ55_02717 [Drechmeria coniospora]|nr:hypothetical protein RJ55_02717 [Drechmeria coniospora]